MGSLIEKIEPLLAPLAEKYIPEGSDIRAVIHHWVHAIANGERFVGVAGKEAKNKAISLLKESSLFTDTNKFKADLYKEINFPPNSDSKFRFIDLFAGIGGFRLALQSVGGTCCFSSEWDKAAQKTYFDNYGELPFGDITAFTNENISDKELDKLIPDHEVLAGGFPCQPFSHAGVSARTAVGKEHGFKCDTQGTLFFDIMRIASVKKPKVLFLENVRNIERHENGKTFSIIKKSIDEIGYDFEYEIIDASTLVPQRRVRCYMVCFRKDLKVDFEFPSFEGKPKALKTILEKKADDKYTISDKLWLGHINRTQRNLDRGTGFTAFVADIDKPSNTLVARYGKDGKECLIPQEGKNPRFLTPRECALLQGYPKKFIIPSAKTPAYKQFGNSVAVPVIAKIAEKIIKEIL